MNLDARDVPVSGASAKALEGYETALTQFQSYVGDPVATLDATLAEAPGFVMGHLFKALALFTSSEKQFVPMAEAALAEAVRHLAGATERERALAAATRRILDGDWDEGSRQLDRILVEHPRDALVIQVGHLMDFYRGDSLNLRNRISRVLPQWDESVPGYSYLLGMHAFGLEEMNQYAEAEATGRRALELQRKDGWALHAVTHVMEMQGRVDEGIAWLETRQDDWAPDNNFAFHNWWHLALFYLDAPDYKRALELYDAAIHPQPAQYVLPLVDATAMLWRLHLEGVDLGSRFEAVADDWQARQARDQGFYAFNDFHALLAFAATGRYADMTRQLDDLAAAARQEGSNGMMSREVGLPLAHGIVAFARGQYAAAIDFIEPVRDIAHRFGGSHAQRDLLSLTLIEAALRGNQPAHARHYLAERQVHKPNSAWRRRLAARLPAAQSGSKVELASYRRVVTV
ncbi:MAG TPA: tetratricopeptide repeat protein [Burkholderiales bacterium]